MIVVDASVIVAVLRDPRGSPALVDRCLAARSLHAPELIDLEVLQVLRRFVRSGLADPAWAATAIEAFQALRIRRHVHRGLWDRIWQLRENVTAYDAAYLALAELLEAPLLTRDSALGRVPGVAARVDVL